jgi:hypothetical protein
MLYVTAELQFGKPPRVIVENRLNVRVDGEPVVFGAAVVPGS